MRVPWHPLYCELMVIRKLLSLLMSLLLTLSPLAALDVAAAVAGKGDCMMMEMDHTSSPDSDQLTHQSARDPDGQMMPGCAHCKDDNCDNHNCAGHGCSAGHGMSLIQSSGLAVPDHAAKEYSVVPATGLLSHSIPPLLRPPV